MSRYERFMRVVWNSPWSCLVIACIAFDAALGKHGWEEWAYWGVGFVWAQSFWSRGDKRWLKNKKTGKCEVCGKTVNLGAKGGGGGASLTEPGKAARFCCMDHIAVFNIDIEDVAA